MERVELTDDNNNTTEPLARNQARHFHLSNLSYVGPVIMGFGGDLTAHSIGTYNLVIFLMFLHEQDLSSSQRA